MKIICLQTWRPHRIIKLFWSSRHICSTSSGYLLSFRWFKVELSSPFLYNIVACRVNNCWHGMDGACFVRAGWWADGSITRFRKTRHQVPPYRGSIASITAKLRYIKTNTYCSSSSRLWLDFVMQYISDTCSQLWKYPEILHIRHLLQW